MSEESKDLQTQANSLAALNEQIELMNQAAKVIISNVGEDREKADELYDFMRDQIDVDGDRNPATRQAMADAVGHKIESTKQLVEILKIKAKMINPNKGTNVNINLGEFNEKKGGDTNEMIDIADRFRREF